MYSFCFCVLYLYQTIKRNIMKISKGNYEYEYKGVLFQIDNGFGNWAIYYNDEKTDEAIFNWYNDADRVHCLKYVAIEKAKQYIDELN